MSAELDAVRALEHDVLGDARRRFRPPELSIDATPLAPGAVTALTVVT
jgi:hypothetical protein